MRGMVRAMTVELPAWNDLAVDPGKYVDSLTEKVRQAQTNLHQAKAMLRMAERLAAQQTEYGLWAEDGIPEPQPRPARASRATDSGDAGDDGEESDGEHLTQKQRVVALLGQDPQRAWKVRQVMEALGLANDKSLRVSMDQLVTSRMIFKDGDANYRAVQ